MSLRSYQAAPPRIFRIVSMSVLRKSKKHFLIRREVENDNLVYLCRRCYFVSTSRNDTPANRKAEKFSSGRPVGPIQVLFSIGIPRESARMSGLVGTRNILRWSR